MTFPWFIAIAFGACAVAHAGLLSLIRRHMARIVWSKTFGFRDMWISYSDDICWIGAAIFGTLLFAAIAYFENGGGK